MSSIKEKRKEFFLAFVENVSFEGFSIEAAISTSTQIAEDRNYYLVLFPSGLTDIAEYFEKLTLTNLISDLKQEAEINGVTKKIETALVNKIIKSPVSQQFMLEISKFYLKPQNTFISIKYAWEFCDIAWRWAGDQALDYNYYTKRGLLFSIYNASLLYYLQDNSDNHINTEHFISQSLAKIINLAKCKSKIKSYIPKIENIPILRMFL